MNVILYTTTLLCTYFPLTATGILFGNGIVRGNILQTRPRAFILGKISLPAGHVTAFQLYAAIGGRRIRLQIWRPIERNRYMLVHEIHHVIMGMGADEVLLGKRSEAMRTEEGDLLGFTTESKEVAVAYNAIPFEAGSDVSSMIVYQDSFPTLGKTYTFTGNLFDKKFSFSADILPGHNVSNALNTTEEGESSSRSSEDITGLLIAEQLYLVKEPNFNVVDEVVSSDTPCSINNGGCHHICQLDEDVANCSCRQGHILEENAYFCSDIDECQTLAFACPQEEECVNTPGSFSCIPATQAIVKDNTTFDISEMTSDPKMIVIISWIVILTLLVIIAMSIAIIASRRRFRLEYGANIAYHNNQKTLPTVREHSSEEQSRY